MQRRSRGVTNPCGTTAARPLQVRARATVGAARCHLCSAPASPFPMLPGVDHKCRRVLRAVAQNADLREVDLVERANGGHPTILHAGGCCDDLRAGARSRTNGRRGPVAPWALQHGSKLTQLRPRWRTGAPKRRTGAPCFPKGAAPAAAGLDAVSRRRAAGRPEKCAPTAEDSQGFRRRRRPAPACRRGAAAPIRFGRAARAPRRARGGLPCRPEGRG